MSLQAARLTSRPKRPGLEPLFAPRALNGWPPPPSGEPSGPVPLPVPDPERQDAIARGARRGPGGALLVDEGADLARFTRWLPFYARPLIEPLNVDLIPATSFGGSLASLLTRESWDTLRQATLSRHGRLCRICGTNAHRTSTECHEVWRYYRGHDRRAGVQRLLGLLPVCRSCHEMFHLGLANIRGRSEIASRRLMWANRWSAAEMESYGKSLMRTWSDRSRISWDLDLSVVARHGPLRVKGGKTGCAIQENGDVTYRDFEGKAMRTRVLGAAFGHARQTPGYVAPPSDYGDLVAE